MQEKQFNPALKRRIKEEKMINRLSLMDEGFMVQNVHVELGGKNRP